jgi:hypothetical protein
MYGLNEFDIQFLYESQVFDRIQFKLMMNQILNPDLNKIIYTFSELKTVIKCILNRLVGKKLIIIEYKFNGKMLFYDCVELSGV